jgi:hypothetical protein
MNFSAMLTFRFVEGCFERGQNVHDPPAERKSDDPDDARKAKMNQRGEEPPLQQLPQAGDEKTAKGGNYISCGTLACHDSGTL